MKKLLIVSCLLIVGLVRAGDLTPGQVLVDGQTVHAADFNNLVGGSLINSGFYTRQQISTPTPGSDYLMAYSPNGYLYRAVVSQFVLSPGLYPSLTAGLPNYNTNDLFQFYSVGSTNIRSVTFSNLVNDIASNINPVAWMQFAPTNATSGGTNIPVLADWPVAFSGSLTNNQPYSLWWGSNGVPYQLSLSNEESALAGDLGTNLSLPYTFAQMFAPWLVYGTNAMTNAWGYYTNFPITSLLIGTNTTPTIGDNDSIPINSSPQGTNTTVTLGGIYQYLTNKNTLPAYTQARIQFAGLPLSLTVSNNGASGYGTNAIGVTTNTTINPFTVGNFYAVSFITNGGTPFTGIQTNTLFYVRPLPLTTNTMFLQVFTNYSSASANTNSLAVNANYGTGVSLIYLTNYTSFNADVIQLENAGAPPTIRYGYYDVYFRTNAANSLYYFSGCSMPEKADNYPTIVNFASDNIISTNRFRVTVSRFDNYLDSIHCSPLIQLLVNPQ